MEEKAFKFVELLKYNSSKKTPPSPQGSMAITEPFDLTKYAISDWIGYIPNQEINNDEAIDIFCEKENYRIQFGRENYTKFKVFISELLESPKLRNMITYKDLEFEVFKWLVKIKENSKSNSSFQTMIKDFIQNSKESKTFYFPIENLEIEKKFRIGNVQFSFFDDSFFDQIKKKYSDNWGVYENKLKEDFKGKVYASVKSCGIKELMKIKAQKKVEIAVDILKCYGPALIKPKEYISFDLSHRLNFQQFSDSISMKDDFTDLSLNTERRQPPTIFKLGLINEITSELNLFSDFLGNCSNAEIDRIIFQSINLLASALSLANSHQRIAQLFMILESIFMEDNKRNNPEKIKARAPKLLTRNFDQKLEIKDILDQFYQIRHNYVHKAIKTEIDYRKMNFLQEIVLNTIIRLMEHRHFITKENLIIAINNEKA